MYTEQLSQELSIAGAPIYPADLAAGNYQTSGVDMQEFRRAMFIMVIGAFGSSAGASMQLQGSPDNSTWTNLTLTGSTTPEQLASGGNNIVQTVEINASQLAGANSSYRYVRAQLTIATAATFACVVALGGSAVQKPGSLHDNAAVVGRVVVTP